MVRPTDQETTAVEKIVYSCQFPGGGVMPGLLGPQERTVRLVAGRVRGQHVQKALIVVSEQKNARGKASS